MSRYESHYLLWGNLGQEVLSHSSLLICGLDSLGYAIAQSAALLGIGTLYLYDTSLQDSPVYYLDMLSSVGEPRSLGIARALNRLAPNIATLALPVHPENFPFSSLDLVIKCTPEEPQLTALGKPMLQVQRWIPQNDTFACRIHPLNAENSLDEKEVKSTRDARVPPGLDDVLSTIIAGLVIDEVRKYLFKKNIHAFEAASVMTPQGMLEYSDVIAKEKLLVRPVDFKIPVFEDISFEADSSLQQKKMVILGAGSIGTYVTDLLCRMRPRSLVIVDCDAYEEHNLNRQPLAYDGVGNWKAQVLEDKVKRITGSTLLCRGVVGFAGSPDGLLQARQKACSLNPHLRVQDMQCIDESWLAEEKPDILLCCFDNNDARNYVASLVKRLGLSMIDAGSSPSSARVNVYVPGKTRCPSCTNTGLAIPSADLIIPVPLHALNHRSCRYQEGSIVMTNQIAAGLSILEACRIACWAYSKEHSVEGSLVGGLLMEKTGYDSRAPSRFYAERSTGPCNCG